MFPSPTIDRPARRSVRELMRGALGSALEFATLGEATLDTAPALRRFPSRPSPPANPHIRTARPSFVPGARAGREPSRPASRSAPSPADRTRPAGRALWEERGRRRRRPGFIDNRAASCGPASLWGADAARPPRDRSGVRQAAGIESIRAATPGPASRSTCTRDAQGVPLKRFDVNSAETYPQQPGAPEGYESRWASIDGAIGGEHLQGNMIVVPPGVTAAPYHWEASIEEWLLVLSRDAHGAHARG